MDVTAGSELLVFQPWNGNKEEFSSASAVLNADQNIKEFKDCLSPIEVLMIYCAERPLQEPIRLLLLPVSWGRTSYH